MRVGVFVVLFGYMLKDWLFYWNQELDRQKHWGKINKYFYDNRVYVPIKKGRAVIPFLNLWFNADKNYEDFLFFLQNSPISFIESFSLSAEPSILTNASTNFRSSGAGSTYPNLCLVFRIAVSRPYSMAFAI